MGFSAASGQATARSASFTSTTVGALVFALLWACACGGGQGGGVREGAIPGGAGGGNVQAPAGTNWLTGCVAWIQASCAKARSCKAMLGAACALGPSQLVDVCNRDINGGRCQRPDAASFVSCRSRVEAASCAQYCPAGTGVCPDVCAFTCLDSLLPETPDAGPDTPPPVEGAPVVDPALGLTRLPLALAHLVVDRPRRRMYATVSGRSRANANSLAVIDPQSMKVVGSVPVGPDPSVLALSADGSRVWVGVDGDQTLRAVAVDGPALVAGPPRPLPPGRLQRYAVNVRTMVGLASAPDSVALTLDSPAASSLHGTAVLDDGVVRGSVVDLDAGQLVRGQDGWLFGYNDANSGYDFLSISVGPAGLEMAAKLGSLLSRGGRMVYADQRVYAANGRIIDVAQPQAPKLLASLGFSGLVSVDAATTTAFMLSNEDGRLTLRAMDTVQFYQRALLDLGPAREPEYWDFDRLDPDTFVFVGGARALTADEGAFVYLVSNVTARLKSYRVEGP